MAPFRTTRKDRLTLSIILLVATLLVLAAQFIGNWGNDFDDRDLGRDTGFNYSST
ncbi:uncharacterized protein METZ01_LOCUS459249 [marine metagenome]|uniref:Uncharacterized protein n=1 Tax=marine metagenome TaxID=408172 RepID=A0A383AGV3_9ZZZZ